MDKFKCPVCSGRKGWYVTTCYGNLPTPDYRRKWQKCDHCDGTGFLDWIENIVGKVKKKPSFDHIVLPIIKKKYPSL